MRKDEKQEEHSVDFERRFKIIMRQGEENREERQGGDEKWWGERWKWEYRI